LAQRYLLHMASRSLHRTVFMLFIILKSVC